MSLFHLIERRQRMEQQEISEVQDRDYGWQTSARDTVRVFSEQREVNVALYRLMKTVAEQCKRQDSGVCVML